jgi:hypothetical protein
MERRVSQMKKREGPKEREKEKGEVEKEKEHLDSWVDFDEVVVRAVGIEEELHSARILIPTVTR